MAGNRLFQVLSMKRSTNRCLYRCYCEKAGKKYSKTVLLPRTTIPLRLDGVKRKEMDEYILKECDFKNMHKHYENNGEKTFVLHDGPPYANGNPHVGHAVNKVLKDITNRVKSLQGYKVNYIPGWDCHGLPIELKASKTNKSQLKYENTLNYNEILDARSRARAFANETINIQRSAFERWGIIANWDKCYYTFDINYIVDQLTLFYEIYEKGYIFRDYKPVYWSYSTRTALAEAELEYKDHKSTSVYFKCFLKSSLALTGCENVYALVWTTTPWTIPCNKAICYAVDKRYSVIKCDDTQECYLIAANLKRDIENILSKQFTVINEFDGKLLQDVSYYHPITSETFPLLPGKHVTTNVGTGLVHAAPAHGPEDFLVAFEHKIPVECFVDEDGKYTKELGPVLEGKFVLTEGNLAVINLLGDNLLKIVDHNHSYPYDWRSKKPIIIRASSQWFFDTGHIKDNAIKSLEQVIFYPAEAKQAMISQLKARQFWCISRQRVWGVPIPVFYDMETGEAFITKPIINHLIGLLKEHGPDFWWALPDDVLLPQHLLKDCPGKGVYRKGQDIFDIWFDSGASWNSVLKEHNGESDMLIEGTDQITGWFQSALLLSCAFKRKAPYKNLYIHGFAIDENGKKMSKSLGNVVDPKTITDGDSKQPCYGADVLRWWVASHALRHMTIPVGPSIMKNCAEEIQKIRIVLRYLVGILHNFKPQQELKLKSLLLIDQFMLHQLGKFKIEVTEAYDAFMYNRVSKLIRTFVSDDVSAFYCHLIKDRVYCDSFDSLNRQSALTVANHLLTVILQLLSPVLPFLTEEVYLSRPEGRRPFQSIWNTPSVASWENGTLSKIVSKMLILRHELNKVTTFEKVSLRDSNLTIISNDEFHEELKKFQFDETSNGSALCELFQVAQVTRIKGEMDNSSLTSGRVCRLYDETQILSDDDRDNNLTHICYMLDNSFRHLCSRCRRRTSDTHDDVCTRCRTALEKMRDIK